MSRREHITTSITVDYGRSATIANITMTVSDEAGRGTYHAVGEAKCSPPDKFSRDIGRDLAVGRALESIGKKLRKRGENVVAMHDHNRAHSTKAKHKHREAITDRLKGVPLRPDPAPGTVREASIPTRSVVFADPMKE